MSKRKKREVVLVVHDGFDTLYNKDYMKIKDLNLAGGGYEYSYTNTDKQLEEGEFCFVDTTSNSVTIALPNDPSEWARVAISDYANTFYTNHCIVQSNKLIEGSNEDLILDSNVTVEFIFVNDTIGWKVK